MRGIPAAAGSKTGAGQQETPDVRVTGVGGARNVERITGNDTPSRMQQTPQGVVPVALYRSVRGIFLGMYGRDLVYDHR